MDGATASKVAWESSPAPWVHDPTFYPVEEKVGQDSLQVAIIELLRPLIERWYGMVGKPTFVGADQFIYYKQFDPHSVVAPDIYVLPGVEPGIRVKSWKVWETGIVPSFALEVVASKDPEKDYREAVTRYDELGVPELVVFDPDYKRHRDRVRWQRYRKLKRGFAQVEISNEDRMRSHVLGCFLRVVGRGAGQRVRLATGAAGDDLVPTQAEQERAAKKAALAAKKVALAAKKSALAAKEAALARVAELEAQLAKKGRAKRAR